MLEDFFGKFSCFGPALLNLFDRKLSSKGSTALTAYLIIYVQIDPRIDS